MDQNQNNSSPTPTPVPTPGPTPTPPVSNTPLANTVPAFMTADSSLASDNSTPPTPPRMTSSTKKNVLALGGVLALVVGMFMSLAFVRQRNITQTQAWDCSSYGFKVENDGTIKAFNNSSNDEPLQKVSISINGAPAGIFNVPALKKDETQVIGKVNVPTSGSYTWSAVGEKDCQNSGSNNLQVSCPPIQVSPKSGNWNTPGTFTYKNNGSSPVTLNWAVVCQYDKDYANCMKNAPKDEKGTETIQPGESKERGWGHICATWQLDFEFTNPSCPVVGYVAQPENCNVTPSKTPTPKPTVRPSATPTVRPSATPTVLPSSTPRPSATPIPTTPPIGGGPTSTPMPSNTPMPSATPAPTATPGPTSTPRPSSTPMPTTFAGQPNSCNGSCGSDSNCQSGLTCYQGYCRRPDNPSDSNCTSPVTASNNPAPTSKPVTEIPQSGSTNYTLITIIAGAILLGAGALFAL